MGITLELLNELQKEVSDPNKATEVLNELRSEQPAIYDLAIRIATKWNEGKAGSDFMAVAATLQKAYSKIYKVPKIADDNVRLVAGLLQESANKPKLNMPKDDLKKFLKSGFGWTIKEEAVVDYLVDIFWDGYSKDESEMLMINMVATAKSLEEVIEDLKG